MPTGWGEVARCASHKLLKQSSQRVKKTGARFVGHRYTMSRTCSKLVHAETAWPVRPLEFFVDPWSRGRDRAARRLSLQLGSQRFRLLDDHMKLGLPVQPAVRHHHGYPTVNRRVRRCRFSADHPVLLRNDVGRVRRHADPFLPAVPTTPSAAPDDQTDE